MKLISWSNMYFSSISCIMSFHFIAWHLFGTCRCGTLLTLSLSPSLSPSFSVCLSVCLLPHSCKLETFQNSFTIRIYFQSTWENPLYKYLLQQLLALAAVARSVYVATHCNCNNSSSALLNATPPSAACQWLLHLQVAKRLRPQKPRKARRDAKCNAQK